MHIKTRLFLKQTIFSIKQNPAKLFSLVEKITKALDRLAWEKNYMPARKELAKITGAKLIKEEPATKEKPAKKELTMKEEIIERSGIKECAEKKIYSVGKKKDYKCKYCGMIFENKKDFKSHTEKLACG